MALIRSRVPDDAAGTRLDAVLASLPEIGSRAAAERLLGAGRALVDGRALQKSHRLAGGELLELDLPEPAALIPETLDLPLAYEDEQFLIVDKPAGIVVHPTGGHQSGTLVHGVLALGAEGGDEDRPGIVHRLDRDTSGLLLVARSPDAHERLQGLIRERAVERRYLALVRGTPRSRTGRIEAAMGRDRRDRSRHSLDTTTPRTAVTWFETIEQLDRRTLLELRLETGRTHQIRVHLEAVELPICGDPVYGIRGDLGLERQFLHAHRLVLTHPFTGKELDVRSPLPPDLEHALETARARGPDLSPRG
ncbi:MAG: RluA family pseudouridine synthase [Gaiella sp.]